MTGRVGRLLVTIGVRLSLPIAVVIGILVV